MQLFYPKSHKKTGRMKHLIGKQTENGWTERKEEDFNEIRKMIKGILFLVHFVRVRDNIVTTNASRTGLRATLSGKNDNTIRPIAFAGRYLNDTEKKYSIGRLEL